MFSVIEAGGVDAGKYTIAFEARNPSGETCGRTSLALVVDNPGDLVRAPCGCGININADELGIWQVVALSDTAQLASIDLMVKQPDAT
ncbi:MAG TPA: hypothetical protein VG187_13825 [Mycobacterium sp.]|nr:hypothetical protein [Mycobacterium sp.]